MVVELIKPSLEYLPKYIDALERGWSPDNIRGAEAAAEEFAEIKREPAGFIAKKADNREAKGGPAKMPDGSTVPRIPGFIRWIWDEEFCGSIGFRWKPGTADLPSHVLGHMGYSVVPWKQGQGIAKKALSLMLEAAKAEGLPYVELTTDPENVASQRVIAANKGVLVERFLKPPQYGANREGLRYRIMLCL